ncbi:MAG: SDR family NAD(P)-dependent oxidoreductase [Chloroflexi bacterium]|nr:SDR family NAD(P)-dependent oxidoreductase [Chloroflexota bacterium]
MKMSETAVIVTGASAGIGKATAVLLAQKGANVVITARRVERLQQLAAELDHLAGKVIPIAGDIGDANFAQALIAETVDIFGKVDVLVNNAGIGNKSTLTETPIAHMQTILTTNVLGLMAATNAAVPQMKQQGFGQIINISSIVGQRPVPKSGIYCASKTAVNFLTRSLRMELRHDPIKVTLVYPGLTNTEFSESKLGESGTNRFGARGVPAERVGHAIVRAIENGRLEVYVTPIDWLFVHVNRLFPRTLDWIFARIPFN